MNTKSDLAVKYANTSVLESYSADVLVEILQSGSVWQTFFPDCEAPPPDSATLSLAKMNQLMRSIILMTDMAHHFRLLDDLAVFAHTVNSSDTTIIASEQSLHSASSSSRDDFGKGLTAKSASMESFLEKIHLPDAQTKETIMCALLHAAGESYFLSS